MMKCGIANSHLRKIFQRERLLRVLDVEADRIVGAGAAGRPVRLAAARLLPSDPPSRVGR